ncbi:MAG: hypothetical protein IJB65_07090, partial [Clostridia bacterium]|nr:hypothetical protein [Clostridia bacterium]
TVFQHTDGNYSAYTYNADGIRTQKSYINAEGTVGEVTAKYTLDGNRIVAEQRGDTMLYYLYDENGSIMGISYGYDTYTFAKNIQGDVIGIYSGGTLVAKYEYSAYGQILSITNASGTDISNNSSHIANLNPFRYRGYYYDTETGFYYLQSRYYDPVVGRFLNADALVSTGQGILGNNMFAYCGNNPINRFDPRGMCYMPDDIKKCLTGANCCEDNHSTSDYLQAKLLLVLLGSDDSSKGCIRDVTIEVGVALNKATVLANNLRTFVNQMDPYRRLGGELGIYATFYALVNHNAMWDIKRPGPWIKTIGTPFPGKNMPIVFCGMMMTPESLGNFTYGYLGYAYGIPYKMLITGSYYAAGFPSGGSDLNNEITDVKYILLGYLFGMGMSAQ